MNKRAAAALLLGLAAGTAVALPSFDEVRAAHRPSDLTLLDRNGTPVQTLRMDPGARRLPWLPLAEISPALLQAVVLSEDRRFWEHSGVDWKAVAGSAFGNLVDTKTRGASTLTMQLAGLIDNGLARPAGGRSVAQKLGQIVTAQRLESSWKKSQILEAYLNEVPLRGEIVGIGALAQTLFGKHASGLDAPEAAITAALLRAPNAPAIRVTERACGVLKLQQRDCSGLAALTEAALAQRGGMPLGEQLAPHFARQVLKAGGPAEQRSTLDARVQRLALAALRQQMAELQGRNVEDGAVLVLDNNSGEVLAWVGSSGSAFSGAAQVDAVLARRQPGSTLKPFIYALAFERRLITPASLLDDSPAQIGTAAGLYLPQNYDHGFRGAVSARMALGTSLNMPAVRVAALLGPDAVYQRLNRFGLQLPESAGFYGHALALGGAEVNLLALSNAYRALANGGMLSRVRLRPGDPRNAPQRVADAAAVSLVTDVLADNSARAAGFGLDSHLATRGFAAVKTGTSKDMRDNWCVGFTDRYTVGVWVGNAGGEAMHDVSGISGAAPIWQALVRQLHADRPSRAPAPAAGVVALQVAFDGQREPPRRELFIAGTEQPRQRSSTLRRFGIESPRDGSIFALDPDIPPTTQRIRFEGQPGRWRLDGRAIGQGERLDWAPWPGRHRLSLEDGKGTLLQVVNFEVRGAALRHNARAAATSRE